MLKGDLIQLRALEPSDEDIIYQWENDTAIWPVSNTLTPFSRQVIRDFLDTAHLDIYQTKQLRLVIEENQTDQKPVGLIDLYEFDPYHQRAGIGILIANPEDRKRGYASESLQLLVHYAFETLLLNQLFCGITEDNIISLALFKKIGFRETGTRKEWIKRGVDWLDEIFLQLTKNQWLESRL